MSHNCPDPKTRNRDLDLAILAIAVVKDRVGFYTGPGALTEHVADTQDLLYGWVETALGLKVQVKWSAVTDDELPAIAAWQRYCEELFDSVEDFVIRTIRRTI